AGALSGSVIFEANKPTTEGTTGMGPIESVVMSVSDAAGHVSEFVSWEPEPGVEMTFSESCLAVAER
ncbi:MAG: hypothetical protein KDB72_25000, partial [Mycobacterium sp.]|nr:hypothetical protein [Mycobacterium sp.]